MRYLTIVLAKKRFTNKAIEIFEAIGISYDEVKDKASRKLIFANENLDMRFFPTKASDVPTYVEYGAADIGIVGRNTILEKGHKFYEVMDPGMGKCRMYVCEPGSARERLEHHELTRMATKYPNIAEDYSYNREYQTVRVIKLNDSIELASIVGLSGVIADIVETGFTLWENGLMVLGEVCDLSARMVVSQVGMKAENEHVTVIIKKFQSCFRRNAGR